MKYLKNSLMKDEKIILCAKPHWIIFLPSMIWLVITFLVMAFLPKNNITTSAIIFSLSLSQLIIFFTFIIAILLGFSAYIAYLSTDFVITSKRVLMKAGFIRRKIVEVLLSRIESIRIYQSILGRLLNYGVITVVGTGGGTNPLSKIPDPLKFRHIIEEQIENPELEVVEQV